MNIRALNKVYFLGIGGIGMSALARYLNTAGIKVMGYDKVPTSLTNELQEEGIDVHFDDKPEYITQDIDLVIYTPAVPEELEEFKKTRQLNLPLMKRSQLLEQLTAEHDTIAVAGTHGKTTVSTMIAHILHSSPIGCTAFLGGIAKNYNSNLLIDHNSRMMVAEADEYDRSFLRLYPYLAVITSTDADHLDIYSDHQSLLSSFSEFASNIVCNGILLVKSTVKLPSINTLLNSKDIRLYTYSLGSISGNQNAFDSPIPRPAISNKSDSSAEASESELSNDSNNFTNADFYVRNLELVNGSYQFSLQTPGVMIEGFNPPLAGLFNVENCVAASAAAYLSGVEPADIVSAMNSFKGVKRRFDRRVDQHDFLYIDDYAHHPEELKACITSVRKLYPEREITGIFQPHLYTRTRDFAQGFSESLALLDKLILLDIYPAREKPIEGVTSRMLLEITPVKTKLLLSKEEVLNHLKENKPDILLTLGAGDIDQLVPMIESIFNK
jgi:UDP-N-acetylmuramate--alanine ligase